MGRISTKENKTVYQIARENLKLSRPQASELLEAITPEKIERIENEKCVPLNSMDQKKNRLIEIAADGKITEDEMKDFVFIEKELEHISMTVDALQLWIEKMRANGKIDQKLYDTYRSQE